MIEIDHASATPPFEQIRSAIVAAAASGAMPAGTRLPTVRGLAEQLSLAAGTVAKAYRALEADGVIETRGRAGTVIAVQADSSRQRLEQAAGAYASLAERLGVEKGDAHEIVSAALGR